MTRVVESASTLYLGYPIRVTERTVTVYDRDGCRVIGSAYTMSGARRIVRGFRGACKA